MTHVNAQVPIDREIREWKESILLKAELNFWKARADEFASELGNIFDHASATGHVELWRGQDKIDLYTKPDAENGAQEE
jgi:hypothetical protein